MNRAQKSSKALKQSKANKKVVAKKQIRAKHSKITKRSSASTPIQSSSLSFTPKCVQPTFTPITLSKRTFRSTSRSFSEPQATGPAASEDVSPEVQNIIQEILKLNIMQTLQLTKALKKEFGYNDSAFAMAAPVAAAAAGGAAAAAEEEAPKVVAKTAFNIKLESFDAGSKVKVIKEVRTITGLGLKEAKDLVDGAPQILKKEVKKEEAEAIVKLLKDVGAVCILE